MSDTAQKFAAACVEATRNWHVRARAYEKAARDFAQAQHELQLAERDLHELGRALAVTNGAGPHVPAQQTQVPNENDAAAEVLRLMQESAHSGVMP